MSSVQEKEFALFGFINTKLRAGLLIGLLSLSITGNIILVIKLINMQGDLYEKILKRVDSQVDSQMDHKLAPTIDRINETVDRVDTAAGKVIQNQQLNK